MIDISEPRNLEKIALSGEHLERRTNKPVSGRIPSIDLLRGVVMIVMALDHIRDYFHNQAFIYNPEDLEHTTGPIFFTRWITHFCAPVFVFLAGISAYLYGAKNGKKKLSAFLFTRGLWLVLAELFIVTLGWTFNPAYPFFNLQVIWATGISMIVLSGLVYLNPWLIFIMGIVLIAAHNLLDTVHVPGNGVASFLWSVLHEPGFFSFGQFSFSVRYPVLPWIGILALGHTAGHLYRPGYDVKTRQRFLALLGCVLILLFIDLRAFDMYGDAAHWSSQKKTVFSLISFFNVTKYPPSLLYVLMTLGPALIFLSLSERPLNRLTSKISTMGRVPMFYYLMHLFLIHFLALIAAVFTGYHASDMILSTRVNRSPELKGYGFNLLAVYEIWIGVIIILYPLCSAFDKYKRANQGTKWWLSYL